LLLKFELIGLVLLLIIWLVWILNLILNWLFLDEICSSRLERVVVFSSIIIALEESCIFRWLIFGVFLYLFSWFVQKTLLWCSFWVVLIIGILVYKSRRISLNLSWLKWLLLLLCAIKSILVYLRSVDIAISVVFIIWVNSFIQILPYRDIWLSLIDCWIWSLIKTCLA